LVDNLQKSSETKLDINVPGVSNTPGIVSNLANHKITNIKSNTVSSSSNLAASLNNVKAGSGGAHFLKIKKDDDSDEEMASFRNNTKNSINNYNENTNNGAIETALQNRNQNVSYFYMLGYLFCQKRSLPVQEFYLCVSGVPIYS